MNGPQPGRKAARTKVKPTDSKEFGQQRPSLDSGPLPPDPQSSMCCLHITWTSHCFCLCLSPPICSQAPHFCPPLYLQIILYDPLSKEVQGSSLDLAKGSIFSLACLKSHYPFYWVPPGGLTKLLSTLPSLTSSVTGSTLPEEKLSLHASVCCSQAPEDFRGNEGSRGNGAHQVLPWEAK